MCKYYYTVLEKNCPNWYQFDHMKRAIIYLKNQKLFFLIVSDTTKSGFQKLKEQK
jgi:hypothetical protein